MGLIDLIHSDYPIYSAKRYNQLDDDGKRDYFTPPMKCVYAMEMNNGTVKIGVTNNLPARVNTITSNSGLNVLRTHCTANVQEKTALKIEEHCHEIFDAFRIKGEFFNISFEEACEKLDELSEFIKADNDRLFNEIIPAKRQAYEMHIAKLLNNPPDIRKTGSYSVNNGQNSYRVPGFENDAAVSTVIDSDTWLNVKTAELLVEVARLTKSSSKREKIIAKVVALLTGDENFFDEEEEL